MNNSILKYFQLLYDSIGFPIQVVNNEGKVIYVNEMFAVQWGYNLSEIKEYNIFEDNELIRNGIQKFIKDSLENNKYSTTDNYVDALLLNREAAIPLLRTIIFPVNFENDKLIENAKAFINTIIKMKPASAKGLYVKSLFLSSTMGPGLKISKDEYTTAAQA